MANTFHRTNVVAKLIFVLATALTSKSLCTKVDVRRVKHLSATWLKIIASKVFSEIQLTSKAVIEHLFNNHNFCDQVWCIPKKYLERLKKNETRRELDDSKNEKYNDKREEQRISISYDRCKIKTSNCIDRYLKCTYHSQPSVE